VFRAVVDGGAITDEVELVPGIASRQRGQLVDGLVMQRPAERRVVQTSAHQLAAARCW
jgi:hypothetical protein